MQIPTQHSDFHMHTCYSHDCATPLLQIRDVCRKHDLLLGVTDHNEIRGNLALRQLGLKVVPGIEVTTNTLKDFLVYFYEEDNLIDFYERVVEPALKTGSVFSTRTALTEEALMDALRGYDSFVSLAHPYCPQPKRSAKIAPHIMRQVDAIEVMNFSMSPRANQRAADLCDATGKVHTAGSDSHHIHQLGAVQMLGHATNPRDFLAEVAQGTTMIVGAPRTGKDLAKHVVKYVAYRMTSALKPY